MLLHVAASLASIQVNHIWLKLEESVFSTTTFEGSDSHMGLVNLHANEKDKGSAERFELSFLCKVSFHDSKTASCSTCLS